MRSPWLFVSVIPLFIAAYPASAAVSPTDINDCQQMGDADQTIGGCTKIIEDPSVDAPDRAIAFFNRGVGYSDKNDLDHAIADWTQAIKLNPNYAHAYNDRAKAYRTKGDYDRAIADYSEAIKLDAHHAISFKGRGIAYFFSGAMDKAEADFKQAAAIDPGDPYAILWHEIAKRRIDNKPSTDLQEQSKAVNMGSWPAPLILLYAGQASPHEVVIAAQNIDNHISKARMCDVGFYGGEFLLLNNDKDQAAHLFHNALTVCGNLVDEAAGSVAELKALGQTP